MSFNMAQSRVATGLLTGHNTLRRHLHIMGLLDSPLCRKCGAGEETSVHVLCGCEALATLRHIYLGSFFLDPENVRGLSLRANWNFFRRPGLSWLGPNEGAQRACEGLRATGPWGLDPHLLIFNTSSSTSGCSAWRSHLHLPLYKNVPSCLRSVVLQHIKSFLNARYLYIKIQRIKSQ
jgi:hypothetical protein